MKLLMFKVLWCLFLMIAPSVTSAAAGQDLIRVAGHGYNQLPAPPYRWLDYCEERTRGTSPALISRLFVALGYRMEMLTVGGEQSAYRAGHSVEMLKDGRVDFVPLIPELFRGDSDLIYTKQPLMDLKLVIVTLDQTYQSDLSMRELEGLKGEASRLVYGSVLRAEPWDASGLVVGEPGLRGWQKLLDGELDYVIAEHYNTYLAIEQLALKKMLTVSTIDLTAATFYLATLKDHPDRGLLTKIDSLLEEYHRQGRVEMLNQANISSWIYNKSCAYPQARADNVSKKGS